MLGRPRWSELVAKRERPEPLPASDRPTKEAQLYSSLLHRVPQPPRRAGYVWEKRALGGSGVGQVREQPTEVGGWWWGHYGFRSVVHGPFNRSHGVVFDSKPLSVESSATVGLWV